jgi:uncharacterized membrane protein
MAETRGGDQMQDETLGMDRTVAATWAPDDTWPAFNDELTDGANDAASDVDADGGAEAGETRGSVSADVMAGLDDDDEREETPEAVEAVATIEGHPLHPAIVPLPIGSFVGAFLCDLAFVRTHDRFWARGARLLTGAGLLTGLLAGSLGAVDFTGEPRIRSRRSAWVHAAGNLTVLGLAAVSEALRARDEQRAVRHGALAISAVSVAILGVTGWIGGELSYRDRIGVIPR